MAIMALRSTSVLYTKYIRTVYGYYGGFLNELWVSIKIILILQKTALIYMFQKKESESRKEMFHSYAILTRPSINIFESYLFLKQN